MTYRLEFHEEADAEYMQSYIWYSLRQRGLEERFRKAVDEALQKLKANPKYFGFCKKPYRQVAVKSFPL